jgi:hypothetical protein
MTTIRRSLPDLRLLQGRLAPLLPRAVQRLGLRAARQARLMGRGPLDRQFTKSLSVADEMQLSAPNAGAAGASANYVAFRPGKRGEQIPVGTNF